MNKKMKNIYILAAALVVLSPAAMAQNSVLSNAVKVVCNDAVQRGDSLYLDAVITLNNSSVKTCKSLELTPVVEVGDKKEGFLSVLRNGRIRHKVYTREIKLNNLVEIPHYSVAKVNKDQTEEVICYQAAIGWEDWMKDAKISLAADLCGCGQEDANKLLIADHIRRRPDARYEVQPTLAYITPVAETEKHRAEVGTAYLDFQVGKSQILPDFRNNAAELDKINSTIRSVTSDKNITPKGIMLKGYASPEGSYASNDRLSDNRVKALRDYIRSKNDFPQSFFALENEPEDWAGFKAQLVADSEVPARDEVLGIIDSDLQPDQKEAKLRALKGGSAFSYVLINIFPSLRRSEYRIDYTVREFTVEEGREIIKTHPQQLSLSEMFAVANSYETGSKEYNDVFEIAVRMYSSDPVANLNAANISIGKGDYAAAKNYLSKAGDSAEAIHARGVIKLIEGDLDGAEVLLKKANDAGVIGAANNLRELQKKREDNALFDSFNAHN